MLALADGQVVSGLVVSDGNERLVLVDGQGTKHELRKSEIETTTRSDTSPMPEGLHAGLTREEFADLIAYLETLR
jgi:putative heme-binding domain-containing protein